MGLPALKIDHAEGYLRPHLRLVQRKAAPARRPRASVVAYDTFVTFCILTAVLALAALGRVWLSAEAAQATLQSARLREQIKATRFEGDMLEVQESQLASPARIQRIASRDLDMAVAEKTTFIDLRAGASKRRPAAAAEGKRSGPAMLPGVVDSVVGVAAGEARVLLVGDVGLASTH